MGNAAIGPLVIALAQPAPAPLDQGTAVERVCELIIDAGRAGAQLLIVPAGVIAAIAIPSAATDRLSRAARRAGIHVLLIWARYLGKAQKVPVLSLDPQGAMAGADSWRGSGSPAEPVQLRYVSIGVRPQIVPPPAGDAPCLLPCAGIGGI